ncbi:MAG: hypothetical protein DWC06_02135 [Candidatus Poseidoniales archaeon]|nr:MAG: hypothetical protein DWC06_02135 [Candidatus Poseidoniales archaeon]
MSGLLDKANETAKESETSEIRAEIKDQSDAILTEATVSDGSGINATQLKFQLGAVFGFLLTMIIVFFIDTIVLFEGFTLDDILVPAVIICWLAFNGQELKIKEFDTTKLVASGVAFLVLTGIFAGIAIFSASDTAVTISNIEYDGDDDEIDLSFYGPKGMDYTIEVLVDGKVEYSHDATINIDRGSHSVDLDDFWKGNAEDMNGNELVEYEIKVTSEGGEDSMTFDSIMNREVDTAYVRVTEVFETESDGSRNYVGITTQMILGMGTSGASFDFNHGYFTGTAPKPMASDWTADVVVKGGSTYSYDTISADEGIVNGLGEFLYDWVSLDGQGYLDRSDFYNGDGCYTFEVTVVNEHGETFVSTDSQISFSWESNEADSDTADDEPATAC